MSTDSRTRPLRSEEAEQAVLGSILTTPNLLGLVATVLKPEDFWRGRHLEIYETMLRLSDEGNPTDDTAVQIDLNSRNLLEKCGGTPYFVELMKKSAPAHALYYAQKVREESIKRNLEAHFKEGLQRLRDGSGLGVAELLAEAQTGLDVVADERPSSDVVKADDSMMLTLDLMEDLGKREGGITGVPTGFADLDEMTQGLHGGQMIVIAARPGIGKSTLGLDIARSAAIHNKRSTAIFTLEMSHEEIMMRLISAEARIPLHRVRSGKLDDRDWQRVSQKMSLITEAPLFVDDTPNINMTEIKAKARRLKQRFGLDLLIIDYLQLMTGSGRVNSRQEEVAQISRAAKLLAKELGIPVIVMSQLNRGPEQRADKRPAISDLRESGAVEQDADLIILLYREDAADPDSNRVGEADFIIGKHRNGQTGTITVAFQGHYSRFVDMAKDHQAA